MTLDNSKAKLSGEIVNLPEDLYIPPDALRVFLETFEGPLDLLLYLIKKQNIDILDIPIASITVQYISYVELMQELQLELAADYLVMAAMLAEIKSRLLLPRHESVEDDAGADPRAELIERLREYERFKTAAVKLDNMKRLERDIYVADVDTTALPIIREHPEVKLEQLLHAFKEVMQRAKLYSDHFVQRESLSIRERMTAVLRKISADKLTSFSELFKPEEGRIGVVVTLIAILELVRQSMLELVQSDAFAAIYVKASLS